MKTFNEMISTLGRFGAKLDIVSSDGAARVRLTTVTHTYSIVAYTPNERKPNGYLGATCSLRMPYPGEAHTRGNDLHDGSFTEEGWALILADIVAMEMDAAERANPAVVGPRLRMPQATESVDGPRA